MSAQNLLAMEGGVPFSPKSKAFDEGAAASRLGWLEHGYSVLALRQEDLG